MTAYHVFFSPRAPEDEEELLRHVRAFMEDQVADNRALGYQLHRFTNKAGSDLTDFQLIVEYASTSDQEAALEQMKATYLQDPHATIMRLTGTFRVAFSQA